MEQFMHLVFDISILTEDLLFLFRKGGGVKNTFQEVLGGNQIIKIIEII